MEDLGKTEIIDDPIINNLLKKSTKMQQKEIILHKNWKLPTVIIQRFCAYWFLMYQVQ